MAEKEAIIEAVVVFTYKYHGKEGCTDIVEEVPCEYDEGFKKEIIDMDV